VREHSSAVRICGRADAGQVKHEIARGHLDLYFQLPVPSDRRSETQTLRGHHSPAEGFPVPPFSAKRRSEKEEH
jgi:hypothetical protein